MGRVVSRSDERLFMKLPLLPLVLVSLFTLRAAAAAPVDWLIEPSPFKARVSVSPDGRELELNNGLIRRVIRLQPNAATVALDNLVNGESLLRAGKASEAVDDLKNKAEQLLEGKGIKRRRLHAHKTPFIIRRPTRKKQRKQNSNANRTTQHATDIFG